MPQGQHKSTELPSARALHATFRDYIKHEDTLVQYRITWLLVLTGLLLTTYITLYGLMLYIIASSPSDKPDTSLVSYPVAMLLFVPIFMLSIIGFVSATVCFRSILAAAASAKSIRSAWAKFKESRYWGASDRFLPEITFGFSKELNFTYGYPKTVCIAVGLLWLLSMAANIFLAILFGFARAPLAPLGG